MLYFLEDNYMSRFLKVFIRFIINYTNYSCFALILSIFQFDTNLLLILFNSIALLTTYTASVLALYS